VVAEQGCPALHMNTATTANPMARCNIPNCMFVQEKPTIAATAGDSSTVQQHYVPSAQQTLLEPPGAAAARFIGTQYTSCVRETLECDPGSCSWMTPKTTRVEQPAETGRHNIAAGRFQAASFTTVNKLTQLSCLLSSPSVLQSVSRRCRLSFLCAQSFAKSQLHQTCFRSQFRNSRSYSAAAFRTLQQTAAALHQQMALQQLQYQQALSRGCASSRSHNISHVVSARARAARRTTVQQKQQLNHHLVQKEPSFLKPEP
jgi:hypothetical protein